MNSKTLSNIFKGDKVIWMVFFFLCVISVVEVFSASSELTYKGGNYMAPILRHIGLLILGIASMVVTLNIQCKYFKIITPFLLLGSILLLLIVWVTGNATNGASRWIGIMGFQFQPSEFAKGAMVLATAQILSAMQTENGADFHVSIRCNIFLSLPAFSFALSTCSVSAFLFSNSDWSVPVIQITDKATAMNPTTNAKIMPNCLPGTRPIIIIMNTTADNRAAVEKFSIKILITFAKT